MHLNISDIQTEGLEKKINHRGDFNAWRAELFSFFLSAYKAEEDHFKHLFETGPISNAMI